MPDIELNQKKDLHGFRWYACYCPRGPGIPVVFFGLPPKECGKQGRASAAHAPQLLQHWCESVTVMHGAK